MQLAGWLLMVRGAGKFPYFIDEIVNNQAALNFFRELDYRSPVFLTAPFDAAISTGIASSWPSALGWWLGGNIFSARLALGFFGWAQFLIIAAWACRRCGGSWLGSIAYASLLWLLSMEVIPNWMNFIVNLGELSGALWLGTGFLLKARWPRASFIAYGIAVWLGKFIFLPIVGALWAADIVETWRKGEFRLSQELARAGFFFLPLFAWVGLIVGRHGPEVGLAWIRQLTHFVRGNSGIASKDRINGLWNRLSSPALEWSGYGFGFRARVLFLLFLPYGLAALACSKLVPIWRASRETIILLLLCMAFYTVWWFLWNPLMWFRHLQPALYLSFALWSVFGLQLFRTRLWKPRAELSFAVLATLLLILLANSARKEKPSPYAHGSEDYSHVCRDPMVPPCYPTN